MSDSDKKIRVMSPKGFLHKANSAKSALGFMDQYRQYMLTGELASVLSPIVFKVEEGNLLPTPALAEIQNAVFHHIVALETSKAMASMERSNAPKKIKIEREPRIPKNWLATILTASGEIATRINSKGEEEELSKEFDDASSADRFCVRRLVEGESNWTATVEHTSAPIATTMTRQDALAIFFARPKTPTMKQKAVSTSSLGFGVKAKNDFAHFSHG